jgi:signal transduction histidine kinase
MARRQAADESTSVHSSNSRALAYTGAVAAVVLATLLTFALRPWMAGSVSILFFPAVILPAVYAGYTPALLAAVLATASMACFFVTPVAVIDLGLDDVIRLAAFSGVATTAAWLSARRRYAEDALLGSMRELERHVQTLSRLGGWPDSIGPDPAATLTQLLSHAATVMEARAAAVLWESEDEPWVYLASTEGTTGVLKEPVSRTGEWRRGPPHLDIVRLIGNDNAMSAIFETQQVAGRVYFSGVREPNEGLQPMLTLVAHEIGSSLSQMQLANRMRQLAVHEDRIRVSRDLHDGVLQGLTGARFELQSIADTAGPAADRLRALERALAAEQRELRLFIDDLRPSPRALSQSGAIATRLREMCARLSSEWRIPVTVRVTPADVLLPDDVEQAIRLMVHEGVSNALKHSHPSRVAVDVNAGDAELCVCIADDGLGFSFRGRLDHDALGALAAAPATLRERVNALDGRMSVESHPTGSRVEFVLPIGAQRRATA